MTTLHARIDHLPGLKLALACGALLAAAGLSAQTLSSPIAPAPAGAKPAAAAPGFDVPVGQGPGVHGANSPFPPLAARTDVVPWSVLTAVKTKTERRTASCRSSTSTRWR